MNTHKHLSLNQEMLKNHNVTVVYHVGCSAKYRRVVFDKKVNEVLKETCLEISKRYAIDFLEIGLDRDHAHFLIQSVPMYSPKKVVEIIRSITAKEILEKMPWVKQQLWGGPLWGEGDFINTVGEDDVHEDMIAQYVKDQDLETDYEVLHRGYLLAGRMSTLKNEKIF